MTGAKQMARPTVLAAGYRGTLFVSGLIDAGLCLQRVISYRQAGDQSRAFERLAELACVRKILFQENRHPSLKTDKLIYAVGWQFLLNEDVERCVIFHDSLMPRYRGFSPTVTALLCGDGEIGVTAFRPVKELDAGPVFGRRTV
jgi:methionyl-tRNA formyltransferase